MRRVAFYIESMILGGAEKVLLEIVNRLDPSLFDITVISIFKESVYPTADTYDFTSLVSANVRVITLIDNSHRINTNIYNHLYSRLNKSLIYSILVHDKYDIEVAFYEGLPTEFVSHSTNRESLKYAWLHTDNNRLYENKPYQYIEKIHNIYSKYNFVIGVSNSVKESFLRFFPDIPCTTIYNGIDFAETKRRAEEDCEIEKTGKTTFISVGRLVPVKGYDRLLNVCRRLLDEGYQFSLFLIGDGSERETLESYIQRHGMNSSVKILGKQDNPYRFFDLCDAYICSSVYEGFGLAIIEAMSCGLPVLSTDFPSIREIMNENDGGWNIGENSEEGLYHIIKEALTNPQKLKELIPLSLQQSKRFDIRKQIQSIQELFLDGDLS